MCNVVGQGLVKESDCKVTDCGSHVRCVLIRISGIVEKHTVPIPEEKGDLTFVEGGHDVECVAAIPKSPDQSELGRGCHGTRVLWGDEGRDRPCVRRDAAKHSVTGATCSCTADSTWIGVSMEDARQLCEESIAEVNAKDCGYSCLGPSGYSEGSSMEYQHDCDKESPIQKRSRRG